ncbi:MAG: LysE family transporter [Chloroflexota bacterium]
MFPALLSLIVISFTGVMMPGPMFAVTLTRSYKSPWAGPLVALGHAVVEVPLILLIYFGFAGLFQHNLVQISLSILGGGMVIWLGVSMFRARNAVVDEGREMSGNAFTAGIMMSGLNPFFLLWWVTVGSLLIMRFSSYGLIGLTLFILAHWLCDFIWLSFVSTLVYRTHAFWGRKFQEWLFIACSLLLLVFGGWFLVSGIKLMI